jgi:predicted acyl esterase
VFSTTCETSKRQYDIIHELNVAIPARAGFTIDYDVFRSHSAERFPAILRLLPFSMKDPTDSIMPVAVCPELVSTKNRRSDT